MKETIWWLATGSIGLALFATAVAPWWAALVIAVIATFLVIGAASADDDPDDGRRPW